MELSSEPYVILKPMSLTYIVQRGAVMLNLTTALSYTYFLLCLSLGWIAAGILDYDGIIKSSSSKAGRFLFRLGVALVLAEGFRIFLSFVLGPFLDALVNRSLNRF